MVGAGDGTGVSKAVKLAVAMVEEATAVASEAEAELVVATEGCTEGVALEVGRTRPRVIGAMHEHC